MFTGIIEEVGEFISIEKVDGSAKFKLRAEKILENLKIGDSIAINGVCLTVVDSHQKIITADLLIETLEKTNLKYLQVGDKINLERALQPTSRIGGHFVTGHVDGMGKVIRREKKGADIVFTIEVAEEIIKLIAPKGSIAVDGISLTVVDVEQNSFTVHIIPHTIETTTMKFRTVGDYVNIEADILARYLVNFLSKTEKEKTRITEEFLAEHGLI